MLKILVTYAVQGEFVELKWFSIFPCSVTPSPGYTSASLILFINKLTISHDYGII